MSKKVTNKSDGVFNHTYFTDLRPGYTVTVSDALAKQLETDYPDTFSVASAGDDDTLYRIEGSEDAKPQPEKVFDPAVVAAIELENARMAAISGHAAYVDPILRDIETTNVQHDPIDEQTIKKEIGKADERATARTEEAVAETSETKLVTNSELDDVNVNQTARTRKQRGE